MSEVTREHLAGLKLALCGIKGNLHHYETFGDVLELVEKLIAQASAAPGQEPVAWLYSRPEGLVAPVVLLEKASDKDRGSWDETPLYTHADPSEVERLRQSVSDLKGIQWAITQQRDSAIQRADAAERKLEERVPLYEAVNRACGELSDGWQIQINMERGCGCVELYDSNGVQVDDFPSNNERLDYTVNDALEHALETAKGGDGEVQ